MGLLYLLVSSTVFADSTRLNTLPITLKETLQYALEHSPALDTAQRKLSIAENDFSSAKASFAPSLDLSTSHGLQKDSLTPTSTDPWTSSLSLALTETLYDNGTSFIQYRSKRLARDYAALSYQNERDKLCRDIASAFFQYSLAEKLNEVQIFQHGLIKKQFELISGYYHQGIKTKKDFLRFKNQLSRAEIGLVTTSVDVEKAKNSLYRIMGIPPQSLISELPSFSSHDEAEPEINNTPIPLENHYEFRLADLQKEINAQQVKLVERKYWPVVTLSAGASYLNSSYLNSSSTFSTNQHVSWNILLGLSYNLWDWGTRKRDWISAEQTQWIQDNIQNASVLVVKETLNTLMLDLEKLTKSFKLSKELLEMEQNSYQLVQTEYKNGTVNYLDLITALQDLSDAKIKFYTSMYSLKDVVYRYRYHQGVIYETFFR